MTNNNSDPNHIEQLVSRWADLTQGESDEPPRLPLPVILGEAIDVAEVVDSYYQPQRLQGEALPGLQEVVGTGPFTQALSLELRELQIAARTISSRYNSLLRQEKGVTPEQAQVTLREIRAALSFLLEDGTHTAGEEQLERLRDQEQEASSHDEIAVVLEAYSALGEQYREELQRLGGFDPAHLPRAMELAQGLRMRSARALTGEATRTEDELLGLRNRLLNAMLDRMREARRAIRYVFRDHPEIVRKATSEYSRNVKRRSRSRQAKQPQPPEVPTTVELS